MFIALAVWMGFSLVLCLALMRAAGRPLPHLEEPVLDTEPAPTPVAPRMEMRVEPTHEEALR
jgi:hypothetical protein